MTHYFVFLELAHRASARTTASIIDFFFELVVLALRKESKELCSVEARMETTKNNNTAGGHTMNESSPCTSNAFFEGLEAGRK